MRRFYHKSEFGDPRVNHLLWDGQFWIVTQTGEKKPAPSYHTLSSCEEMVRDGCWVER